MAVDANWTYRHGSYKGMFEGPEIHFRLKDCLG